MNGLAKSGLAILTAAILVPPLYAQSSAMPGLGHFQTQSVDPDPSEIVCEKIEMIGSRLSTKKVCMTRSQWADSRRQDREAIEKIQASPCVLTQNGANGRPSC